MRVGFREADFESLACLWNGFFPDRYAIDEGLLRANTADSPVFDWGSSSIEIENGECVGFAAMKKSANPSLYPGGDPDQAHICALVFRDAAAVVDLCADAKRLLRNRGVYKIVFGEDSRHFFPGCPEDCPALKSFLTIAGFEEGEEVVDLERDLDGYEPPGNCLNPLGEYPGHKASKRPKAPKALVRALKESDREALDMFLLREFPGRWHYDTFAKADLEGGLDFVYGLFVEGALEGFAVTQDSSHKLPVGGAVWKRSLGDSWGALGPIGVSKRVRKRGFGDALLGAALLGLQSRGVRRTIIDWTGLVDFYGKHGFEPTRWYRQFALRLD